MFKIRLLDETLNKIRISHDLTREQRWELSKLVTEAKAKQAADDEHFLYRVRGAVGRWKIVKLSKKD